MGLYIPGIDVSDDQGSIDWALVKGAGIQFAILKCGNGNEGLDGQFGQNVKGAKAQGIACGLYHFIYPIGLPSSSLHPYRDAVAQAKYHWSMSQGLGCAPGDIQPFMDLEWPDSSVWGEWGCSSSQIQDYILLYKSTYEAESGVLMGIYTDHYWWSTIAGANLSSLASTPFWPADPQVATTLPGSGSAPLMYKPFASWSVWQYSWKLKVPGIVDAVDGDCIPDQNTFHALTTRP
jgi:GH25 family lysozyme M1 (1,4-beta-N-acetylmuramidase)